MIDLLYILLIVGLVILMWTIVGIVAISREIRKRTDQALLIGIGYFLLERFSKK